MTLYELIDFGGRQKALGSIPDMLKFSLLTGMRISAAFVY
jgi:hypothetical protein